MTEDNLIGFAISFGEGDKKKILAETTAFESA